MVNPSQETYLPGKPSYFSRGWEVSFFFAAGRSGFFMKRRTGEEIKDVAVKGIYYRELAGMTVKEAVKEGLEKQSAFNPQGRCSVLTRLARYGVTAEDFWQAVEEARLNTSLAFSLDFLQQVDRDENLVALTAGVVHLLDEYEQGLLSRETVLETGIKFIVSFLTMQVNQHDEVTDPVRFLCGLLIKAVVDTGARKKHELFWN